MNPESEWQLREAVSAALQAALTRVRASLGGGELLPLRRKTTWAREGKSLFPTERVTCQMTPGLESAIIAAFEALPEVEALRRVIAGDEALRRLVTESLNSSFLADPAGQLFHLRVSLLMPCLRDYLESRVNFAWEESHFEPIFQDIVKRVDGEPVPFEVIAPLHPFSSEIDHEELGEGASISRVGIEELSELCELWGTRPRYFTLGLGSGLAPPEPADWTHAIKYRIAIEHPAQLGWDPVLDVLTALRLLKESAVGIKCMWGRPLRRSFDTLIPEFFFEEWSGLGIGGPLELDPSRLADLASLFQVLSALKRENEMPRNLDLALRRLNSSATRQNDDERLIDYWVAFESLFANDSRGEIIYRAKGRVSRFLSQDFRARQQIANSLRTSYKHRSAVVHGDRKELAKLAKQLNPVTTETGEILRRALRKILVEKTLQIDYDALDLS